jgi:uncharacterized protein with FMN-binding domain
MRKTILVVLSVLGLALPSVDAWAAAHQTVAKTTVKKKVTVATKSFTGTAAQVDRWGLLQVTILVKKTTTTVGTKKTVARKMTSVKVPVFPNHTDRSNFINQQALPMLVQEALQAQSSGVNMISGATDTSYGFSSSLQSAILQAKAWK